LVRGPNPFGSYLRLEEADDLAAMGRDARHQPWGMYELTVADPVVVGAVMSMGLESRPAIRGREGANESR